VGGWFSRPHLSKINVEQMAIKCGSPVEETSGAADSISWEPFSGNEEIIANRPANLADGQAVEGAKHSPCVQPQ
jgi:hypothetical protein